VRRPGSLLARHRRIAGGGAWVLISLGIWNLGNFIFFVAAGRLLGPDDYGLVAALLAATLVVMVPASAFQYAVAREEGTVLATGGPGLGATYRAMQRRMLVWVPLALLAIGAVVVVAGLAAGGPVGPMLATLLVVAPMIALYLSLGQLQAESRFRAFAVPVSMLGIPRPLALLALAALGMGVYAALVGSAVALLAAAAAGVWFTRARLRESGAADPARVRSAERALGPLAVGLAGIAVLTNLDVVVAKLALPDQEAGEYGAVSVLARSVVLVPQAVSIVLLPRIAARRAGGRDTGPLLGAAVGLTLAVGAVATLLAALLEEPIVRITYGEEYVDGAHLLAPLTGASTLLGAIIVLVNHHAGRSSDGYIWSVGLVALLLPVMFVPLHGSGGELILADVIVYIVALAVHEVIHGRGPDGILRGLLAPARGVRSRPAS
jgi:O-antigen/teichoic acid export membrane protein